MIGSVSLSHACARGLPSPRTVVPGGAVHGNYSAWGFAA
jgi:hypothetical protein